jgi:hypothetical protein
VYTPTLWNVYIKLKVFEKKCGFLGPNYGDGLLCPKGVHTPTL